MVYIGEWFIKGAKVAGEGRVTIAIKGGTCRPGNGLNWDFFAVQVSISVMEMIHLLLGSRIKVYVFYRIAVFSACRLAPFRISHFGKMSLRV